MSLLQKFQLFIKQENLFQPKDRLLLAVSGGVDSVVLCDLCKQAGYDFVMAHCNFQLRGEESERDEQFVKGLADKYYVEVFVKRFDTTGVAASAKKSIETAARDLRYQWFNELLAITTTKFTLTAHHADDVIETVTMNFFRGTGIAGLHGILPKQASIVRPLLFARRSAIEQYAAHEKLDFLTDSTNLESNYTRNFFRNEIIPLVKKNFSEAEKNVLNNVERFKETEILYQQSIELHKKKLLEPKGNEVHIPVLKLLKTIPLATVLYEIIKDYNFTAHQTDEAIALLNAETGKYISSNSHRIIKNRNWLIISPVQTAEAQNILIEETDKNISFGAGKLEIENYSTLNHKLQTTHLVAELDAKEIKFPLLLRKWKQGDYFYPLGMTKKKKLSRFFTDQKLSLTQKENTWVVEMDKKIIWVIGMRIDNRFKVEKSTKQVIKMSFSMS